MAEAVENRMTELGISPGMLEDRTGFTAQGLMPIRKGYRRRYQGAMKYAVCDALGWTPDSIDRLLRGDQPVVLNPPSRPDDLAAEVAKLWRAVLWLAEQSGADLNSMPRDEDGPGSAAL